MCRVVMTPEAGRSRRPYAPARGCRNPGLANRRLRSPLGAVVPSTCSARSPSSRQRSRSGSRAPQLNRDAQASPRRRGTESSSSNPGFRGAPQASRPRRPHRPGFAVDVVSPTSWSMLTAADFARYRAIILGDWATRRARPPLGGKADDRGSSPFWVGGSDLDAGWERRPFALHRADLDVRWERRHLCLESSGLHVGWLRGPFGFVRAGLNVGWKGRPLGAGRPDLGVRGERPLRSSTPRLFTGRVWRSRGHCYRSSLSGVTAAARATEPGCSRSSRPSPAAARPWRWRPG
jgi:hypothetical protein